MLFTKQSLGLTALAATSTLGAYLLYTHLLQPSRKSKGKKDIRDYGRPEDFVKPTTSVALTNDDGLDCSTNSSTCSSSLAEADIEQVWTSNGDDVDIKVFRQILDQKQEQPRHGRRRQSKMALFSHLLNKLERTMDERDRIQDKLGSMRDNSTVNGSERQQVITQQQQQQRTISTLPSSGYAFQPHSDTSVCMVVQRYRGATILINERECVRVGAKTKASLTEQRSSDAFCGLLVYVSFANGCTQQAVKAASKIVVNLPILTMGAWGDGVSKTMNVIDMAKQHPNAASLCIVPQASLINKVKSQGKSIQYHGQIEKSEGNTLYQYFVNSVRGLVLEQQCQARQEPLPDWYQKSCSAQSGSSPQRASPSIPPEDLFRHNNNTSLYKSWDDNGIPLTDAEDEPITKSAQKRLRKAQAAHRVRHLKYLRENPNATEKSPETTPETTTQQEHVEHWATAIDPSFVHVVAGTFGKRQSLEFVADMGPFCHVIQV